MVSKQDQELMVNYAALILIDGGLEVTEKNLNTLLKAAGATVEPYMPSLVSKALDGKDASKLIDFQPGAGGAGAAAAPAAAGGAAPAAAAVKEEEPVEEEEEEDLGFSLFG